MCTCMHGVCVFVYVCMSSLAVPLSSTATEECDKVERESLVSAVTDHISRQVHYVLDQGEVEMSQ